MLLFDSTTGDAPPFALFEEWVDSVLRRAPLSFRYYPKSSSSLLLHGNCKVCRATGWRHRHGRKFEQSL